MALTWSLAKIKDHDELWVKGEHFRVYWIEEGKSDPEDGFFVKEDGAYRKATDAEVAEAKAQLADEVVTTRRSKHDPEIQVRKFPKDVELYEQGYQADGMTNALIWASLQTNIGTITEENAAEVFRRVQVIEDTFGALMSTPDGPVYFTQEDITRRIGLYTNASFVDEPKRTFNMRLNKIRVRDGKEKIKA